MLTPPPILPFKRLRIYDGLSIDADRCQSSHRYHRLRQNFHYQSLNQGGVVCSLGVHPIFDPTQVSNRSSANVSPSTSRRWVRIQPGIAIDGAGNPIIVAEPITFQFQSELRQGETQTIYLVVTYRDPDDLRQMSALEQDYVQEMFRIQERTILDPILDVELCRVLLSSGDITISLPQDLMMPKPGSNCLDFNHRAIAQTKPQSLIQIGLLGDEQNADRVSRWAQLLQSLPQLHSQLCEAPEVAEIPLLGIAQNSQLDRQHLLYIDQVTLLKQINSSDVTTALRQHTQAGGVLVIQVDPMSLNITELTTISRELRRAIADSNAEPAIIAHKILPTLTPPSWSRPKPAKSAANSLPNAYCLKVVANLLALPLQSITRAIALQHFDYRSKLRAFWTVGRRIGIGWYLRFRLKFPAVTTPNSSSPRQFISSITRQPQKFPNCGTQSWRSDRTNRRSRKPQSPNSNGDTRTP
jgi:hypothetical protein